MADPNKIAFEWATASGSTVVEALFLISGAKLWDLLEKKDFRIVEIEALIEYFSYDIPPSWRILLLLS